MALQQKIVPLNFAGGLDKKTDAKQVDPSSFLTLQNTLMDAPGAANKRNGYRRLGKYIAGTNNRVSDGKALATRNDELISFDANNAYSYSEASNQLTDKGGVSSVYTTLKQIDTNASASDYDLNGATHESGLQCYVFVRDTTTGTQTYVAVVDTDSGQIVRPPEAIFTDGWRPKVIVYRNSFLIYVVNRLSAVINVASLSVLKPLATLSFTQVTGNAVDVDSLATTADYQAYDVIRVNSAQGGQDAIYLVFNNRAAATGTSLWWFDSDSFTSPQTKINIASQAARRCTVIFDVFRDGPAIAFWDGTTLRYRLYNATLVTLRSFGNIAAAGTLTALTGVSMSETFVDLRWYYRQSGSTQPIYAARTTDMVATISIAMGIPFSNGSTSTAVLARGVRLASKAWVYEGVPYVAVTQESILQCTYFVLDAETGRVVVRALPGYGGLPSAGASFGTDATYNMPEVSLVGTSKFRFAAGQILGLGGATSVLFVPVNGAIPIGASSLTLDFNDAQRSYRTAEAAGSMHLGGGLLQMYDGLGFVEHGFNLYPEGQTATGALSVTGLSAGSTYSYQYVGVYEWNDNAGNLHRSAPSVPVTVTSSAVISAANDAAITFPTLRLTQKTPANGRGAVLLAVYRTEDAAAASGGTLFYRLPYTSTNINDASVDSVTITDDTEDADLIAGAPLYTTGDVVANLASPPPLALVAHKNRLWVVDSTNPLTITYSKQLSPGVPVEFGQDFTVNVNPLGGDVTGLASLDDKLIIFKRGMIYFATGDGPSDTGLDDDISAPIMVTSDSGCINQRSIGTTPDGIMFQSDKGIKLLTRALAVVDIGAPVSGLDAGGCTSTVQVATKDQLRLSFDDRTVLCFDYFVGQWSQFTNIAAVDSLVWQGQHVYLRSDGTMLIEDATTKTDDGSFIPFKIKTAWLQFGGMQGYQRLYRVLLLGTYKSPHTLYVDVAYDFNPTIVQTLTITPTAATTYGSVSPYGSESVYGGVFAPYQWRVNPTRQKCQSIQLTIRDAEGTDPGASCTLSGMTAVVGVIPGPNRMPATQSVG